MSIIYQSSGQSYIALATADSFALDAGSNSDRYIAAFMVGRNGSSPSPTVTYNSVDLGAAKVTAFNATAGIFAQAFGMAAPATGSNTLAWSNASQIGQTRFFGAVFYNVLQTGSVDDTTPGTGNSTNPGVLLQPAYDNELLIQAHVHERHVATSPDVGIQLFSNDEGAWCTGLDYLIQTTKSDTTLSWTYTAADEFATVAFSVRVAAAPPAGAHRLSLLRVGH